MYSPPGPGPFPLVVINHGKAPGDPRFQHSGEFYGQALEFVKRGYVVLAPNRSGFSKSGGKYVTGCDMPSMGQLWADDVAPVIDYARKLPNVDSSRIVVIGQSQGGLVSLAIAARNLPGVLGIVDFAGGMRNESCVGWEAGLIQAFAAYGQTSRVPVLFVYGDNDSYFPVPLPHRFFEGFNGAGGHAEMLDVGTFERDSHQLFHSAAGREIWMKPVADFFTKLGLSFDVKYDLSRHDGRPDVEDVELLSAQVNGSSNVIAGYRRFLWVGPHRAFAFSSDGHMGFATGDDANTRAVALCEAHTAIRCQLYAVDQEVVYPPVYPASPPQ